MSHITSLQQSITINNLAALKRAIEEFCPQLEFVAGQTHYRTWKDNHQGRLVGDWPLPEGMTAEEIGENAVHVIRVKEEYLQARRLQRGDASAPYEIGVVPHPEKPGEYLLMTDWYSQGNGLLKCQGVGARHTTRDPQTHKTVESAFEDLYMHYRMMEDQIDAERVGDQIQFERLPDGTWKSVTNTQARMGVA